MRNEIRTAVRAIIQSENIFYGSRYEGQTKRDEWDCDSWHVTFSQVEREPHVVTFDYFTGLGHRRNGKPFEPDVAGVLYSLIAESDALDMTFSDWCDEFGYSDDSIKALGIYNQCRKSAEDLKSFFDAETLAKLADILQDY